MTLKPPGGVNDPVISQIDTTVLVSSPTGIEATDRAAWQTALATGKPVVIAAPGTYVIAPGTGGRLKVPDNTTVVIPVGTTVKAADNTATGATNYVLFAGSTLTPTNVHFIIDGVLDGNRRGGNHGASESIFGITLTDGQDCSVSGRGKIWQLRGDAVYFGFTTTIPRNCVVTIAKIHDCGIKEVGDSGNPRMGVSFIAGTDCGTDGIDYDTIGGYANDFEGNNANCHFDGCFAGPRNRYRDCGQGSTNWSTPGTISSTCRDFSGRVSGTVPTVNINPVPTNRARYARKKRASTSLTLNTSSAWVDVDNTLDLTLPAQPGDIIEVQLGGQWGGEAIFSALEVQTVGGATAHYAGSDGGTSPANDGVPAWRGTSGVQSGIGGGVWFTVVASDLTGGTVTLRLRGLTNGAANKSLQATTSSPLVFMAKNLGSGW